MPAEPQNEQVALDLLTKGWAGLLSGHGMDLLTQVLSTWLPTQRWFGAKTRTITALSIPQWVLIPPPALLPTALTPPAQTLGDILLFLNLAYHDGSADQYLLPLAYTQGETIAGIPENNILTTFQTPTGPAVLHDASTREEFRQALLGLISKGKTLPVQTPASAAHQIAATLVAAHESLPLHDVERQPETDTIAQSIASLHSIETADVAPQFVGHMPGAPDVAGVSHLSSVGSEPLVLKATASQPITPPHGASRLASAEQSNTNFLYADEFLLKLFRRLQPGQNPDVEIGRFLTAQAAFRQIAPLLGELTLTTPEGDTTIGMLQPLIPNQGDGWAWTLEQIKLSPADPTPYLGAAALLGRRTAELHLALAAPTPDPAFGPERLTPEDLQADANRIATQIRSALDALQTKLPTLDPATTRQADEVLAQRDSLIARAALTATGDNGQKIRIHGDYHLGQILRTGDDFTILDFEGEPARSLADRRRKQSPLKDVAGMIRSFSYAAAAAGDTAPAWLPAVTKAFLDSYTSTIGRNPGLLPAQPETLLSAYLLEKSLYELLYELNNRPTWVAIPLAGILALPR